MSLRVKNTGSSGGANLIIDGVKQTEDTSLISIMEPGGSISVSTLSYDFYCGCAVVYNNELHILGGGSSSYQRYHYKWNGTSWVSVSTLPYNLYQGSAVVYNNEIHILGSGYSSTYYTSHYKWDGTSWVKASTLPYKFYLGCAVVLNDEIHILGSNQSTTYKKYHYKWNGSSWTSVSTLPVAFAQGSAVVWNNEIHLLGGSGDHYAHYKWDETSWASVSILPYDFYDGGAVVFNNEIHLLDTLLAAYPKVHYKWNGTSWVSVSALPYDFSQGSAVVFNDDIHLLGGNIDSSVRKYHYALIFSKLYKKAGKYIVTATSSHDIGTYGIIIEGAGEYLEGETVTVSASSTNSGLGVTLIVATDSSGNILANTQYNPSLTFTMPGSNVVVNISWYDYSSDY